MTLQICKRHVYLMILASTLFSTVISHGKTETLGHGLQTEQIAPNAYIITDTEYFWSNTLAVKMKDGTVVLASSPYENLGTETLLNWIQRHLQPKKIIAINTHYHFDGTGGNETFKKQSD